MKIGTRTLVSLLIASATISRQPTLGSETLSEKRDRRLERLLLHHDKKAELRSQLFNKDPAEVKNLQKKQTLKETAVQHGFEDLKSFRRALHGKIKDELRRRGWSSHRIEDHIKDKTSLGEG